MLGHSNNDSGSGINRYPGADAPDVIPSRGVERSYTPAEMFPVWRRTLTLR